MPFENVSDETIEQQLSNLDSGRLGDFVIVQHGTPEGGGPYVQFKYVTRRRGRFLYSEAGANEWLSEQFKLSDEQMDLLEALGWERPKKKKQNWSRDFQPNSRDDLREIVAIARQTFREAYGVPADAQLTLRTQDDSEEEQRQEKLARREERLAEKERASRRVSVIGSAIVDFDGETTITVRRGFRSKKTYEVEDGVSATVESGENLRTHPTLTRTAAGFAVTGTPIGAAWWKKTGSVFLLLEGPDWAELVELKTKQAYEAQKLAQQVNLAARLAAAASGAGGPSSSVDAEGAHTTPDPSALLDHLERLAKLRQQGALTDEEFEAQKRRLLQAA